MYITNKIIIAGLGALSALYYYYKRKNDIEKENEFKKNLISGKVFNENIKDRQIIILNKYMECILDSMKYHEGLNNIKFEDFMNRKYNFSFTNEDSAKFFNLPKENKVYSVIIPDDANIICDYDW